MARSPTSRQGKHRKGKVRIQIVVHREVKAVLVYSASFLNMSLTDFLLRGGLDIARANGIVDSSYHVTPEHKEGVSYVKELLNSQEGDK